MNEINKDMPQDPFVALGKSSELIDDYQEKLMVLPIVAGCRFNGTATGTNLPEFGKGIRSILRTSTGLYTLVFNRPLRTDRYIVFLTPTQNVFCAVTTQNREGFKITVLDTSAVAADVSNLFVAVILP